MSTLPRIEDIWTSTEPVALNRGDSEVVRFVFDKMDPDRATVDIVLRDKKSHQQLHYRFYGVVLEYLPPIQSPYPLLVTNLGMRKHEVPRNLSVSINEDHPDTGVVFYAASVERIA